MSNTPAVTPTPQRLVTGIEGLDTILQGGLFQGGIYLVEGEAGTGKTILGNQVAFHHAAMGGSVVYVTLLAEMHTRLLAHLSSLSFFDATAIPDRIYYISGYSALEQGGLTGLRTQLRQTLRDRNATLLVLDGMETVRLHSESTLALKQFMVQFQALMETSQSTTLLLDQSTHSETAAIHAMVEGMIVLRDQRSELRAVRELEVKKFRGSAYLRGGHRYRIEDSGVVVYPRTELVLARPSALPEPDPTRLGTGVNGLDQMLAGGLLRGSFTVVLGAPGSGKSLLGLHFLAQGAQQGQKGLHFGFFETPPELIHKARQVQLNIEHSVKAGTIQLTWCAPLENLLDAIAGRILNEVHSRGIERLVIDGFYGLQAAAVYQSRITAFLIALAKELRAQGVTTLLTTEMSNSFGPSLEIALGEKPIIADNILLLRYVELGSHLYRLISVVKANASAYNSSLREFRISNEGIEIADTFATAEAILTGVARWATTAPPSSSAEREQP